MLTTMPKEAAGRRDWKESFAKLAFLVSLGCYIPLVLLLKEGYIQLKQFNG